MTLQEVQDVLRGYDAMLSNRNIIVQRSKHHATLAHVRGMANEVQEWGLDRREKAHRWLGFVQGVLVVHGLFDLDDVKEHSRMREVGLHIGERAAAKVVAIT